MFRLLIPRMRTDPRVPPTPSDPLYLSKTPRRRRRRRLAGGMTRTPYLGRSLRCISMPTSRNHLNLPRSSHQPPRPSGIGREISSPRTSPSFVHQVLPVLYGPCPSQTRTLQEYSVYLLQRARMHLLRCLPPSLTRGSPWARPPVVGPCSASEHLCIPFSLLQQTTLVHC